MAVAEAMGTWGVVARVVCRGGMDFWAAEPEDVEKLALDGPTTPWDMVPSDWWPKDSPEGAEVQILHNGVILEPGRFHDLLKDGDIVHVVRTPGVIATGYWALNALISIAIAAAVAYASSVLLGPSVPPREPEQSTSTLYNWTGPRSQYRAIGLPVPMPYGESRTGGLVIQSDIDVETNGSETLSTLRILLLLGAGEIEEIGGYTSDQDFLQGAQLPSSIQINGNSAVNFQGIVAHVRMGTVTQEPIPNFNSVRVVFPVDLTLQQEPEGSTPILGFVLASGYDMTEASEAAKLTFIAPSGLGSVNSQGNSVPETVSVKIRYTEIDAFGVPIGSPQDVVPVFDMTSDIVGQVGYFQRTFNFLAPGSFTGLPEETLRLPGGDDLSYLRADSATIQRPGGNTWAANDVVEAMSAELWVKLDGIRSTSGKETILYSWVEGVFQENGGANASGDFSTSLNFKGFFVRVRFQNNPGRWIVSARFGSGTTQVEIISPSTIPASSDPADETAWHQIGFSYERNSDFSQTQDVYRLIIDGQVVVSKTSTVEMVIAVNNSLSIGYAQDSDVSPFDNGRMSTHLVDQFVLFQASLSSTTWANRWSAGIGTYQTDVSSAGVVLVLRFGETTDAHPDSTSNGNNFSRVEQPGGSVGTQVLETGVLIEPGDVIKKKGRYRIEVERQDPVKNIVDPTVSDEIVWESTTQITFDALAYPTWALLALEIPAQDQLSDNSPNITVAIKGRKVPVWDGFSTESPTFVTKYSNNPAWCIVDAASDPLYGTGRIFPRSSQINAEEFGRFASFCDTQTWDRGTRVPNPRVTYYDVANPGNPFSFSTVVVSYSIDDSFTGRFDPSTLVDFELDDGETDLDPSLDGTWFEEVFTGGPYVVVAKTSDFKFDFLAITYPAGLVVQPVDGESEQIVEARLFGTEVLMSCDGVLAERRARAWDVLLSMARSARSTLIRTPKLRPIWQRSQPPIFAFSRDNIVRGTFKLDTVSRSEQFNIATMEIQDRFMNYERDPVTREHESLSDESLAAAIKSDIFEGRFIVRRSQATRELDYQLNVSNTLGVFVEFQALLQGAFVEVGQVVTFAHELPNWGDGGSVLRDASYEREIVIDHETTFERGKSYKVGVKGATQNGVGEANLIIEQNLLTGSEQMNNTGSWTVFNGCVVTPSTAVAPDGTTTMDRVESNGNTAAYIEQNIAASLFGEDLIYTYSVYLRKSTSSPANETDIVFYAASGGLTTRINIDWGPATPVVSVSSTTGPGSHLAFSSWDAGTATLRVGASITYTTIGSGIMRARIQPASSGSGSSDRVNAWGAQVWIGSGLVTYTGLTAPSVTRVAGESLIAAGDLLYINPDLPSNKNLLLDSTTFKVSPDSATAWKEFSDGICTLTNAVTGPYGEDEEVWLPRDDDVANLYAIAQDVDQTNLLQDAKYVFQIAMREVASALKSIVQVQDGSGRFTIGEVDWIPSTPTFTEKPGSSGPDRALGMDDLGNGWFRFWVRITADVAAAGANKMRVEVVTAGTSLSTGALVYISAAQLELAETPSAWVTRGGSTKFQVVPRSGDTWIYGDLAPGKEFLVTAKAMTPELELTFRAFEYKESVFDLPGDQLTVSTTNSLPLGAGGRGVGITDPRSTHPRHPEVFEVREESARLGGADTPSVGIVASWRPDAETAAGISKHVLWVRRPGDAALTKVRTVNANGNHARFTSPDLLPGELVEVLLQPVMKDGTRMNPAQLASRTIVVTGLTKKLQAPLTFAAAMRGNQVVYSWTQSRSAGRIREVEARAGGWILGQRIFLSPGDSNAHGPTEVLASTPAPNSDGDDAVPLIIKNRLGNGQVSNPTVIEFDPDITNASVFLEVNFEESNFFASVTLDSLTQVSDPLDGRAGILEFTDPDLSGSILTDPFDAGRAAHYFVYVTWEARQRHPSTMSELGFGANDPEAQRWTMEGPTPIRGEETECSIILEWRTSTTGDPTGSAWRAYEPGEAYLRSAQFRLVVTRPDTTFQIRIRRMTMRFLVPPPKDTANELHKAMDNVGFQAIGFATGAVWQFDAVIRTDADLYTQSAGSEITIERDGVYQIDFLGCVIMTLAPFVACSFSAQLQKNTGSGWVNVGGSAFSLNFVAAAQTIQEGVFNDVLTLGAGDLVRVYLKGLQPAGLTNAVFILTLPTCTKFMIRWLAYE